MFLFVHPTFMLYLNHHYWLPTCLYHLSHKLGISPSLTTGHSESAVMLELMKYLYSVILRPPLKNVQLSGIRMSMGPHGTNLLC